MPPEAAREDAGGLDGRRFTDPRHRGQDAQREPPAPALVVRIVLGVADDLDDGEDVLPARRVADGEVSLLYARAARRGMRTEGGGSDLVREEPSRRSANEEPVLEHRRFLSTLFLTCALLGLAGCGDSSSGESAPPPAAGTTTTTAPTTTAETTDPLAGAGTNVVVGTTTAKATALLDRVAVGHHEGYDRVVFQFRGEGLPGYRVEYMPPPLKEDGSGDPVDVAGSAFVVVRMEPASGFDLNTGEGELVYKGPKRLPGTGVVKEVVRTGDFEAVLSWAVGLAGKVPFRVTTAAAPSRLIVDFKND
jgi:hypothetical protein